MFEKIFGVFRKRKQTDVSQEIPGDLGEDSFGADTGFEEDFDADTISLETGASGDSGFSDSGGAAGTDVGIEAAGAGLDEDQGMGLDLGDTAGGEEGTFEPEGPLSPPPDVEEYVPSSKKGGIKSLLVMAAIVVVCLLAGFFGVRPVGQVAQKMLSKGPTPAEQLAATQAENAQFESKLASYRAVGNIEAITAIRDELKKRSDLLDQTSQIEGKIADRPSVETRLENVALQLDKTKRELVIQKGALANVEKAVKQVEARNNYLITSAQQSLDLIESSRARANLLKERLNQEIYEGSEAAAQYHYSIQKNLNETALEALSSS
ncbi:MAG: hypothetical protein C4520_10115 [Candidatus Abyssobacteria bacterium SURF_5]|uniref:Uncharacterized protein n=1 Tax=Abyssobacteria bacterium (strain SURF_5) TaxID=2093360 RepID=A0A3A4NR45_ABYX5|nr:MAG: hypothetical protein C4520_10115 [Candidatus Abyssubacteria bacterium SURF_5]